MELAELCEDALVNYLSGLLNNGQTVWPASMQRGAGQNFALRIFAGESEELKDGQLIFCVAEKDFPEHIPSSGIYEVPVKCVLRTPTQKLTAADKSANAPEPLANHSAAADAMKTALMANGLELSLSNPYAAGQTNGFTVFGINERQPGRDQTPDYWESSWSARLICAPSSWPN